MIPAELPVGPSWPLPDWTTNLEMSKEVVAKWTAQGTTLGGKSGELAAAELEYLFKAWVTGFKRELQIQHHWADDKEVTHVGTALQFEEVPVTKLLHTKLHTKGMPSTVFAKVADKFVEAGVLLQGAAAPAPAKGHLKAMWRLVTLGLQLIGPDAAALKASLLRAKDPVRASWAALVQGVGTRV